MILAAQLMIAPFPSSAERAASFPIRLATSIQDPFHALSSLNPRTGRIRPVPKDPGFRPNRPQRSPLAALERKAVAPLYPCAAPPLNPGAALYGDFTDSEVRVLRQTGAARAAAGARSSLRTADSRRHNMNPRPTQLPRATPWRSLPCPRTELRLDLVLCGGQTFRLVRPLAAPSQELQPFSKASPLNFPLGPFLSFFASPFALGWLLLRSHFLTCPSLGLLPCFLPPWLRPRVVQLWGCTEAR